MVTERSRWEKNWWTIELEGMHQFEMAMNRVYGWYENEKHLSLKASPASKEHVDCQIRAQWIPRWEVHSPRNFAVS
jgi:hypothetical protein